MGDMESCTCGICKEACARRPGWFAKGEVEKVAEYLGISVQELFNTKLQVDYWITGNGDTYVLLPATTTASRKICSFSGMEGRCVFLTDEGLCGIHPVKPFECKNTLCCDNEYVSGDSSHYKAYKSWENREGQKQIQQLLNNWEEK